MVSKQLSRKYTALHDQLLVIFDLQEEKNKEIMSYYDSTTTFCDTLEEQNNINEKLQLENPGSALFDTEQYNLLKNTLLEMVDFINLMTVTLEELAELIKNIKFRMEEMMKHHKTFSYGNISNKKVDAILNKEEGIILELEKQQIVSIKIFDDKLEVYKNIRNKYYEGKNSAN